MWLPAEGYRKLPYAMLAAAGMVDGAIVHASGLSARAVEFAELSGLDTAHLETRVLPEGELRERMGRTHVSLYVTQSECAPMLPFESMAAGVPCLIGPTSHLFEDDPELAERLVVPYPDRAEVIAGYVRDALAAREEIVAAYRRYAPGYAERARASVKAFLTD